MFTNITLFEKTLELIAMVDQASVIVENLMKLYPQADRTRLITFVELHYKREEVNKKTLLFSSGQSNTRHYFVEKGMLRLYLLDAKGREFNILFATEGQVLGDLATPQPTVYFLETVENSIVHSISNDEMLDMSAKVLSVSTVASVDLIRRSYVFLQKRMVSILSKTAEDNYLDLRDHSPALLQRLPQYHIASYLGVSAEFLSKIIARTSQ